MPCELHDGTFDEPKGGHEELEVHIGRGIAFHDALGDALAVKALNALSLDGKRTDLTRSAARASWKLREEAREHQGSVDPMHNCQRNRYDKSAASGEALAHDVHNAVAVDHQQNHSMLVTASDSQGA